MITNPDFQNMTKRDLIDFCFDSNSNVDSSIPVHTSILLKDIYGSDYDARFHVMDYTNSGLGHLVNLKEKCFEVMRQKAVTEK